jgi:hypothetical protein
LIDPVRSGVHLVGEHWHQNDEQSTTDRDDDPPPDDNAGSQSRRLHCLGTQAVSVDEIMTDTATAAILGVDRAQFRQPWTTSTVNELLRRWGSLPTYPAHRHSFSAASA